MNIGATYTANIWLNLVEAVFHERAHVRQFESDASNFLRVAPNLLIPILDNAADKEARDRLREWCTNDNTPEIIDMGWLSEEIQKALNGMYSVIPDDVSEELDCLRAGVHASVDVVISQPQFTQGYGSNTITRLRHQIAAGKFGKVINNKHYLSMEEFLTFTNTNSV
jgi:hypothetical protein